MFFTITKEMIIDLIENILMSKYTKKNKTMSENEFMLGNYVDFENQLHQIIGITKDEINLSRKSDSSLNYITYWVGIYSVKPIILSKYWCEDFGYLVISESSAGFKYGFIINHIFSSDLNFVLWKTTKDAGKFFRGDLQLKYVHQLQNLHFSLTTNILQLVGPKNSPPDNRERYFKDKCLHPRAYRSYIGNNLLKCNICGLQFS